ncbi:MAG TPA: acyltransferase family protein [Candidatus Limnocylindrales bacterium]|nr:acyltransferase family protein [Candidatus Limnocylindrales bacterium]
MSDRHVDSGSPSNTIGARLPYLPGLDGLRALAVAAVVLYHAEVAPLSGGFLGVDLFFVISGFLITSILLAEWERTGRLDLRAFWLRRARRLLPALFVLLIAALAFAVLFLPESVARLRSDVAAAAAYVTNWYLLAGDQSYFETIDRQSPLLHLWSLAVEEQFYLAWPLILLATLRVAGRRGALVLTVGAACGSAAWMAVLAAPDGDPSRVYYGTDTRIFAPLAGAALAFLAGRWGAAAGERREPRTLGRIGRADPVAVASLAVLGWFAVNVGSDATTLYTGGLAVVALSGTLLVGSVVHPDARLVPWLLERSGLRWLGTRSYGIYLWHWPILSITRPGLDVAADGPVLLAARLAVIGLLAEVSYRVIERPIRSGGLGRAWRRWRDEPARRAYPARVRLAVGGLAALLPATGLAVAVLAASPPSRPDYLPVSAWDEVVVADVEFADPVPPDRSGTVRSEGRTGARPHETASPDRPILVIGDSIIISTGKALARELGRIEIDAEVGRHAVDGVRILEQRREAGRLSEVVVIDLGTNGPLMRAQFERAMEVLSGVRLVVWVNVSVPRTWEEHTNLVLAQQVPRYPNARLVDWYGAASARRDLFRGDGYHPTAEGAALFAALIADAVREDGAR